MTGRFKPRADAYRLRLLHRESWKLRNEPLAVEGLQIAAEIAKIITERVPREDFDVLKRYGYTCEITYINVRVYNVNNDRWDQIVGLELINPIEVPSGARDLYIGGPFQDHQLPERFLPFFEKVLAERQRFYAEGSELTDWPVRYKEEHGRYPTWSEVLVHFNLSEEITG